MSTLVETGPPPDQKVSASRLVKATKFLLSAFATAASVVAGGWMTSLSMVMYTATLSLLTFAFLPFALIALGIALPFLMAVLVLLSFVASVIGGILGEAITPADPSLVIDGASVGAQSASYGVRILAPYYKWLSRMRHPALWGMPVGGVIGAGILWGLITWYLLPREARTAETLVATRDAVIARFKTTQVLPPVKNGHLLYKDIEIDLPGPVVDGFGQPLEYDSQLPTFRLQSRGFDQRPGTDDFCITGKVELNGVQKLLRWKELAKNVVKNIEFKFENGQLKIRGKVGIRDAAKLITDLRCAD